MSFQYFFIRLHLFFLIFDVGGNAITRDLMQNLLENNVIIVIRVE